MMGVVSQKERMKIPARASFSVLAEQLALLWSTQSFIMDSFLITLFHKTGIFQNGIFQNGIFQNGNFQKGILQNEIFQKESFLKYFITQLESFVLNDCCFILDQFIPYQITIIACVIIKQHQRKPVTDISRASGQITVST
jgi:hypothetical protein